MAKGSRKPAQKKYINRLTRTKDIDQVHQDVVRHYTPEADEDLPGLGKHYCVCCARHFVTKDVLDKHFASKPHKRRAKEAIRTPFTEKEALLAAEMTIEETSRPSKKSPSC